MSSVSRKILSWGGTWAGAASVAPSATASCVPCYWGVIEKFLIVEHFDKISNVDDLWHRYSCWLKISAVESNVQNLNFPLLYVTKMNLGLSSKRLKTIRVQDVLKTWSQNMPLIFFPPQPKLNNCWIGIVTIVKGILSWREGRWEMWKALLDWTDSRVGDTKLEFDSSISLLLISRPWISCFICSICFSLF